MARVQSLKLTSYCESCECVEFYHHSFFHLSGSETKKQLHFLAVDLVIKKVKQQWNLFSNLEYIYCPYALFVMLENYCKFG